MIKSDLSKATHKFYCNRDILDKETRNIFVKGSVNDIMKNRKMLLEYNFDDVYATAEVFAKVFPIYISQYPSPVSLFGTMIMGKVRNELANQEFSDFLTPTLSEFEIKIETKLKISFIIFISQKNINDDFCKNSKLRFKKIFEDHLLMT